MIKLEKTPSREEFNTKIYYTPAISSQVAIFYVPKEDKWIGVGYVGSQRITEFNLPERMKHGSTNVDLYTKFVYNIEYRTIYEISEDEMTSLISIDELVS